MYCVCTVKHSFFTCESNYVFTHPLFISYTGSVAFTISASDPEGDTLTYTLTGPNAGLFRVNSANGEVTVNSALDREVRYEKRRETVLH